MGMKPIQNTNIRLVVARVLWTLEGNRTVLGSDDSDYEHYDGSDDSEASVDNTGLYGVEVVVAFRTLSVVVTAEWEGLAPKIRRYRGSR